MDHQTSKKPKNILESVLAFINYWWFRYLMVTELYIVESWERVLLHVILAVLFCLQWWFNSSVLCRLTASLFGLEVSPQPERILE